MADKFLYETIVEEFGKRTLLDTELPDFITRNLKYAVRPYQLEAFQRFLLFMQNDFDGKQPRPNHLLFNMATGSGKTLIMAGAILYLYEQGYRECSRLQGLYRSRLRLWQVHSSSRIPTACRSLHFNCG